MASGARTRPHVERTPPRPDELAPHLRARRERIVASALALLEAHEYDDVQIREVAEHAHVALGTLYRYFTSKEHLYAAALLTWATTFEPDDRPTPGGSDEERLRRLLLRAVRAFERWPQILRAEIALEGSSDPNARVLFEQFSDRYLDVMLGALHDVDPEAARRIVETVNAVLATQLRAWALGRESIVEVRRSIEATVALVFNGPSGVG